MDPTSSPDNARPARRHDAASEDEAPATLTGESLGGVALEFSFPPAYAESALTRPTGATPVSAFASARMPTSR